ncbi:MAG TPA: hypothetical protein VGD91_20160 [Trebonia sp.]
MSASPAGPPPLAHKPGTGPGVEPGVVPGRPSAREPGPALRPRDDGSWLSPGHADALAAQLLDLAGQARGWQHALVRTSTEVEALSGLLAAVADRSTAGLPPGQAARAVGTGQVRAALSALPADAGTVTWLCIRAAGREPSTTLPGAEDPVGGPLLARAEPVRMLICTPDTRSAHALAGAHRGMLADSLRVARLGPAPRGTHGDLVIATRADAIAVVPDAGGALSAEQVSGTAVNTLVRALVDLLWDRALPPAGAERFEEVAGDPVKLEILGLLEAGAKDEVIARALGVSLRTCRRHIAELISAAGAVSRFQAASRLARAGLLSASS